MPHLGDSLRTYWCGPSGHDFTVARRRSDGTMSTVLCLACQKRQAPSTCLFCDAEDGTRMTVSLKHYLGCERPRDCHPQRTIVRDNPERPAPSCLR